MSSTTHVSITARRVTRPGYRGLALIALTAVTLVGVTRAADAQPTPPQNTAGPQMAGAKTPRWEFDIPSGAVVPIGAQRGAIKRGTLTAAQLSYVVRPDLAITATFGLATSRDLHAIGKPRVDVFTYDLGAELRAPRWMAGHAMTFSPFAAIGAGGRSYNYRHLDVDATHNIGAYVGGGGELGFHWVRLRVEVRDYVTGFKPLGGGSTTDARNDVTVLAGVRLGRR
jgi:hypothetical protein